MKFAAMARTLCTTLVVLGAIGSLTRPCLAADPATIARLQQRLADSGKVRVIVRLDAVTSVESDLASPQAVEDQRAIISATQSALVATLAGQGARVTARFRTIPFIALEVDAAAFEKLRSSPLVIDIQEDDFKSPSLLDSTRIVGADQAWAAGFDGTGQTVAIIDTGVDRNHPFFGGRVVREACFAWPNNCPNGLAEQFGAGSAAPCFAEECFHGTHVAGIAAGRSSSFSGVARGASIIAVQVFEPSFVGCNGGVPCAKALDSNIIMGLEYVASLRSQLNIAAVNISIGSRGYTTACDIFQPAYKAAIDNLRSAGIAVVVASGNDGFRNMLASPACISSAISVGAVDKSDRVAYFSNSASFLSLLAPGVDITSSLPGGGYEMLGGTSMAAPHVAGAWAVIKQKAPSARPDQVLNALRSTGVSVVDPKNGVTTPRIQVRRALDVFQTTRCACRAGVNNFCFYPANTLYCPMTAPGGYCDPNGDGSTADADWRRGFDEARTACGDTTVPPTGCECRSGVDNFCFYPANTPNCPMTAPGGYCDPNGDGSTSDADWARGFAERSSCSDDSTHDCDCRAGVDNVCLYPNAVVCGYRYCDPNSDGNKSDADWVRGFIEYQTSCSGGGGGGGGGCECRSDIDNYCFLANPRACGYGYCDPNGDGDKSDADWSRGFREYQDSCCRPGTTRPCYTGPDGTEGVGICRAGTQTCNRSGKYGACQGEVTPRGETCGNGADDDCDGSIDEGCADNRCFGRDPSRTMVLANEFPGPINFALAYRGSSFTGYTIQGRTSIWFDSPNGLDFVIDYDKSFSDGYQQQVYDLYRNHVYTFRPTDQPKEIWLFDDGPCIVGR